jgi:hypothetical protein
MASPQDKDRTNTSRFMPYVTEVIKAHATDPRVLWWGIFNEPHGGMEGWSGRLKTAAYGWALAAKPIQPVTSCWDRMTEKDNLDAQVTLKCSKVLSSLVGCVEAGRWR